MDPARFETMEVASRIDRLRAVMAEAAVEALVVGNLTNVRYLSGFTGSAGLLVVTGTDALLVTDGRYTDQAAAQLAESGAPVELRVTRAVREALGAVVEGLTSIGLEAASVTWEAQRSYAQWWGTDRVVPTDGLVEGLRIRKDRGELDRMAAAAAIADAALEQVAPMLGDEPTERAFARELDHAMLVLGAEARSFETIVASGPNAARPHARPGDRRITSGETVVVDFGAVVDGYHSDMTRTLSVGPLDDRLQRLFDAVLASQAAGVAAVSGGVEAAEVDRACRSVLIERGLDQWFTHGTGHGVGLDIHEAPWVSSHSTATLAAGQVVTVEPGVYVSGVAGVRIEDTVVVTDDGCDTLTTSPKTLDLS
ncbi:MAG: aminopeptidase P family protein [Microthrixaceae bacterium]